MPLDVAVIPKTLTSTLHYLKRGAEKPAYYRVDPPPGVPRWNGEDDLREVTIEDARGREAEFTLDRNGFQLVKAPTAVRDFYDVDEIKRVYYPEIEQLLKDRLGASRLEEIAQALGVNAGHFFEGLPDDKSEANQLLSTDLMNEFLADRAGMNMMRAFCKISDRSLRRQIMQLIHTLSGRGR